MLKPLSRTAALLMTLLCLGVLPAGASSIPGHIYSACRILQANPDLAKLVGTETGAYYAGCAGPDIAYVASDPKDRTAAGAESHYERTGDLCISLLREATTPAERAFALGWVTHWLTDIHIHTLVNAYGGNWEVQAAHARHAQLEVVEVKHVHSMRGSMPGLGNLTINATDVPIAFLIRAFAATYDKAAYKPDGSGTAPFASLLFKAAIFIATSTEFYRDASENGTGKSSNPLMNLALQAFDSNVPTQADYEGILQPLAWVDRQTADGTLSATVNVRDTRLYGKFLVDWQATMDAVCAYSPTVIGPAVALARSPSDAGALAAARSVLWNIDLDNPARNPAALAKLKAASPALFSLLDDGTLRGNPPVTALQVWVETGNGLQAQGSVDVAALPQTGFDRSRVGTVALSVPANGGTTAVYVSLGNEQGLSRPELEGVEFLRHAEAPVETPIAPEQPVELPITGTWVQVNKESSHFGLPDIEGVRGYKQQVGAGSMTEEIIEYMPWCQATRTSRFSHTWSEPPARFKTSEVIGVSITTSDVGGSIEGQYPDATDGHGKDAEIALTSVGLEYGQLAGESAKLTIEQSPAAARAVHQLRPCNHREHQPLASESKRVQLTIPPVDLPDGTLAKLTIDAHSDYGRATDVYTYRFYRREEPPEDAGGQIAAATPRPTATGRVQPTPAATPSAPAAPLAGKWKPLPEIGNLRLGTDVAAGGRMVSAGTRFRSPAQLVCAYDYAGVPANTAMEAQWVHEGKDSGRNTDTAGGDGTLYFGLRSEGGKPLLPGTYQVTVVQAGKPVARKTFTVTK